MANTQPHPDFIGYVGDPDFHDGRIRQVTTAGTTVQVVVEGASAQRYLVIFTGITGVTATHPEGMLLYALVEWRGTPPARRFVFANWDEEDAAALEILAETFTITPLLADPPA